MPSAYVPPHLRGAAAIPAAASTPSNYYRNATAKPSLETLDRTERKPLSSSTLSRNVGPGRHPGVADVPDPVFEQWRPSDRAMGLTPEQIEEVRQRLNVDVTVTSDSTNAPPPIESFNDMHCLAQPQVRHGDGPLALVLAPTRELAQQIEKEVKAFSKSLETFRTAIVVGGTNIAEQRAELRAGVHILVATPGRFIDHLQQGNTSLSRISFVVLDEADRMLDMGFEPQIQEVMRNLPRKHQTLLFSATMPVEIETLAQEYLNDPIQVKVGKVSSPTANVSQILVKVTESEKIDRLLSLLVEEESQAEICGHIHLLTIVFVQRKTRCDEVAESLVVQGLHAVALHGGRSQNEREAALHDFRKGSTNILVATDVASRGLDVSGVAHVVNLDLPKSMEDYVHRIGRTGRAGSIGRSTSFYTDRDMFLVAQIRKAMADAESGNIVTFATGKVARRKEKEAAAAQRETKLTLSKLSLNGPASINIEEKYWYMLVPSTMKKEGAADDAWDD